MAEGRDILFVVKVDRTAVFVLLQMISAGANLKNATSMFNFKVLLVVLSLHLVLGTELSLNRTAKLIKCVENQQYEADGHCCLNCGAGTFVSKPCTLRLKQGTCSPCEQGKTYTEHPNGMDRCLQCTQCRMDQTVTQQCTSVRDTLCQCKDGSFCMPDEACEVCKKCTKCKLEEEEVKKCTPTSNTVCRLKERADPTSPSPDATSNTVVVLGVLFGLVIIVVIVVLAISVLRYQRRHRGPDTESECPSVEEVKIPIDIPSAEEKQNTTNADLEEVDGPQYESRPLIQETHTECTKSFPVEDEDRGLGDSLPNTTNSSQTSLPTAAQNSPGHSPLAQRQPREEIVETVQENRPKDDVRFGRLVPLIGEANSLRKSFDLFDSNLDVRFHNKFFRSIGVPDNAIKNAENNHPSDKVYELLQGWMQREGLRANINTLIQALEDLDQRYSAENIISKAVERGYYRIE
ncbi:tumor necrosis factor receptor superfamily, member a isoform X2 [Denticeps clupeoides]|uniref:tumor necrosis factor receptor superfamily, member a isoform X2 n=1 Tax=Denticeps clupeoides TaxID=299321 RepID=UPI0010A3FF60|nr:tumor necrosis factor receptor superfamily member 14-like isoform X2 [Denticeps clupeoides]